jgi:hypothetical protein
LILNFLKKSLLQNCKHPEPATAGEDAENLSLKEYYTGGQFVHRLEIFYMQGPVPLRETLLQQA